MSVKFKIDFTITGETLFALMSKMLPIDDLHVEEIIPKPTLAERAIAIHKITHKPTARKKIQRASPGPSLKSGINMVIVHELGSGPKRALEMQAKVSAAGFSRNSVNSRLESLRNHGIVERIGDGRWKLKDTNAA